MDGQEKTASDSNSALDHRSAKDPNLAQDATSNSHRIKQQGTPTRPLPQKSISRITVESGIGGNKEEEDRNPETKKRSDGASTTSPKPEIQRKRRRSESISGTDYGSSASGDEGGEDGEDEDEDESGSEEGEDEEGEEVRHNSKKLKNAEKEGGEQPPLPPEEPPSEQDTQQDDGWQAIWDEQNQAYYFYNSITGESTWTNPRVPQDSASYAEYSSNEHAMSGEGEGALATPTYYQLAHGITDPSQVTAEDIAASYTQTATFNRFTGKFQKNKSPEMHNDENKSRRQLEFYFDVDAAANSHDGRSLKAERQMRKLSKKELKAFREKKKEKKEQKKRAWLKD